MRIKPTLFVDADDTLWENNIYYEECMANFVDLMVAQGFDGEEAAEMLHVVERERTPLVGYAPEEFARSMVITYRRLCRRHDREVDEEVAEEARQTGLAVVGYPIVLLEEVEETLEHLAGHCRLLLLTKGDETVQRDKVTRSGLERFFEAVHVVPEKDAQVFRDLVDRYGFHPQRTWMVGNSPKSDVNPAVEAGIGAVFVPHPNTWSLEVEAVVESVQVTVVERFADLRDLFDGQE